MVTGAVVRRFPRRWRRSPLRRREDVWEVCALLAAVLIVAVMGPLAGALSARATVETLARQRAERHPATATLVHDAPDAAGGGTTDGRVFADVRWAAPDGRTSAGRTLVDSGRKAGDRVTVWTDARNRLAPEPPSAPEADLQAAFFGAATFVAVGAAAGAGFCGIRVALDRRRSRAWDAEWRKVASQWGRAAS